MLAAALLLPTASSQAIPKLLGVSGSCVGHDVLDRAHVEQGVEACLSLAVREENSATGTRAEKRVSEAEGT